MLRFFAYLSITLFFTLNSSLSFSYLTYNPDAPTHGPNDVPSEPISTKTLTCATILMCEHGCVDNACGFTAAIGPETEELKWYSSAFKGIVSNACGTTTNSFTYEFCGQLQDRVCPLPSDIERKVHTVDRTVCYEVLKPNKGPRTCPDSYAAVADYYNFNGDLFYTCDRKAPSCTNPFIDQYGSLACEMDEQEKDNEYENKKCPPDYAYIGTGPNSGCVPHGNNDTLGDACPVGYYYERECIECVAYGSVATCKNGDRAYEEQQDDRPPKPIDAPEIANEKDYTEFWKYQQTIDGQRNDMLQSQNNNLRGIRSEIVQANNNLKGIDSTLKDIRGLLSDSPVSEPCPEGQVCEPTPAPECDPNSSNYYECIKPTVGAMPAHIELTFNTVEEVHDNFQLRLSAAPVSQAFASMASIFDVSAGECPVLAFDLPAPINETISTDIHCSTLLNIAPTLTLIMIAIYSFIAFRIFASA